MIARTARAFSGRLSVVALAAVLLTAGCAAAGGPTTGPTGPTTGPTGTTTPASPSSGGGYGTGRYGTGHATPVPVSNASIVINFRSTGLGLVLVGPNGLTLYTKSGDSATVSTCSGSCASAWPPLTVTNGAKVTGGKDVTGTFGTLTRGDGSIQVTYNGHPLYEWQGDYNPGDTTGQGVAGFTVARP